MDISGTGHDITRVQNDFRVFKWVGWVWVWNVGSVGVGVGCGVGGGGGISYIATALFHFHDTGHKASAQFN